MKRYFFVILFTLASLFTYSQCCSPGNPIGGDGNQGVLNKRTAKVVSSYRSSTSNQYFGGDQPTRPKFVKRGSFDFIGLNLSYGLTGKLTLESELGYFINKTQEYMVTEFVLSGNGLSDLSLLFKYKLFSKKSAQIEISPGLGVKQAIGPYQQRMEGVLLPIDVQPSNGNFGYVASLFFYKGYIEKGLRFFLTCRAEITPYPVKYWEVTPTKYWIYGSLFTSSFYTSYAINHRWTALVQARFEHRTKHQYRFQNEEFRDFDSSGGSKVFVAPQIVFSVAQKWNLSVLVDVPIYQYYNQTQLANTWAGALVISRKLDFTKEQINAKQKVVG